MRHNGSSPTRHDPRALRPPWESALAALLILAGCARPPATPAPPQVGTPQVPTLLSGGRALVQGPVSSPVFDELKKSLTLVTYDGSQKVNDHDLVILDGDAYSPEELKNDPLVRDAFRAGTWVLGVDLSSAPRTRRRGWAT